MKTQILTDAENNWPEDEASFQCDHYKQTLVDYPEELEQSLKAFRKDCARMETFFRGEADEKELVSRFRARVKKLTGIELM